MQQGFVVLSLIYCLLGFVPWVPGLSALRIVLCTFTAITLTLGPGLVLRSRFPKMNFALVPVPGILLLAGLGCFAWTIASRLSPQPVVGSLLLVILILHLRLVLRGSIRELTTPLERKVLVVFALTLLVAVSKVTYSGGSPDELYGGTISRTYEWGGRSDSRISFHVVQLVAHGLDPYGEEAKQYFFPWNFSHRGPLAGLIASTMVVASGSDVPLRMPDQQWSPFDVEGFAVYRITMIVLAACSLLLIFGAGASILENESMGYLSVLLVATSPFFLHEIYFTWPKLEAASFAILAAHFIWKRKWLPAGSCLALGYLFHPLVLLSVPTAIFLVIGRFQITRRAFGKKGDCPPKSRGQSPFFPSDPSPILIAIFSTLFPLGLTWLLWILINQGHYQQGDFYHYALTPPDLEGWLVFRLESVANTLVPLRLWAIHQEWPWFLHEFCNSLPSGFGLVALPVLLLQLVRGCRKSPSVFFWVVGVPFVIFAAFWGFTDTGLMPEGLHVWYLSLLLLLAWSFGQGGPSRWMAWLLGLRVFEILLMLLARVGLPSVQYRSTDILALGGMLAGSIGLVSLFGYRAQGKSVKTPANSAR